MPIMVMGLAVRKHVLAKYTGRIRKWGSLGALFAAIMAGLVFVGQIVGKWTEGGWVVLITFSILVLAANTLLISPIGYRERQADSPHRAGESTRPGIDGFNRRMAVLKDAGVSVFSIGICYSRFRDVRRAPTGAI